MINNNKNIFSYSLVYFLKCLITKKGPGPSSKSATKHVVILIPIFLKELRIYSDSNVMNSRLIYDVLQRLFGIMDLFFSK